jgi:hypothetical protein
MISHFTFLAAEWPALHEAAMKAQAALDVKLSDEKGWLKRMLWP